MATITIENIDDITLLEYINSNEYKNDEGEIFYGVEDFLAD